ncbi:hypothetical protein [uncultured Tenacibaculum sp.]|uniref:hypothetical protein n=1 Tax=uncultured Tenacibaculum sp. TaxID=174713 RepID=UPI002635DAC2|nr:hypothetical protein [uncultured Tenacibaculum sp.]
MKTYLELDTSENSLFCRIEIKKGQFIEIEEGLIGEKGQKRRTKPKIEIEKAFLDLIEKYIQKGYIKSDEPTIEISTELLNLLDCKDIVIGLKKYFRYLVVSDEILPVFNAIMDTGKEVTIKDNILNIEFDTATLRASLPLKGKSDKDYSSWPKSFQEIVKRHSWIEFPQMNWALHLGDIKHKNKTFLSYSEILKNAKCDIPNYINDPSKIFCPFIDYGSFIFYHPTIKNSYGEPALFSADNVNYKTEKPVDWKVGDLFLLKAARVIDLDHTNIVLPEIPYI